MGEPRDLGSPRRNPSATSKISMGLQTTAAQSTSKWAASWTWSRHRSQPHGTPSPVLTREQPLHPLQFLPTARPFRTIPKMTSPEITTDRLKLRSPRIPTCLPRQATLGIVLIPNFHSCLPALPHQSPRWAAPHIPKARRVTEEPPRCICRLFPSHVGTCVKTPHNSGCPCSCVLLAHAGIVCVPGSTPDVTFFPKTTNPRLLAPTHHASPRNSRGSTPGAVQPHRLLHAAKPSAATDPLPALHPPWTAPAGDGGPRASAAPLHLHPHQRVPIPALSFLQSSLPTHPTPPPPRPSVPSPQHPLDVSP